MANTSPVPAPDTFTVGADGTLFIPYGALLANDTDPDGDPLRVSSVETSSGSGGVAIEDTGTGVRFDLGGPPPSSRVEYSFGYQVADPGGLMGFSRVVVLAGPEPEPVRVTLGQGEGFLLGSEADKFSGIGVRDGPFTGRIIEHETFVGGTKYYVADPDFAGTDRFTVIEGFDPPTGPDTVRPTPYIVTVLPDDGTPDSNAPVPDRYAAIAGTEFLLTASGDALFGEPPLPEASLTANDPGPSFVVAVVSGTVGATLSHQGTFVEIVVPAGTEGQTLSFETLVRGPDGVLRLSTVEIRVAPAGSDVPVARDDRLSVVGGAGPVVLPLLANDTDADGDALRIVDIFSSDFASLLTLSGGVVTLTPPQVTSEFQGTLVYAIEDSFGLRSAATAVITVTPPPTGAYLRGTDGADLLDRSAATVPLRIAGLGGDDTLRGGRADDALNGGAGRDVINGGAGRDVVTGGPGADRVAGGSGADTFVVARGDLAAGPALDLIVDFEGAGAAGGDLLRLTGFGPGATLTLVGASATNPNLRTYEVADGADAARLQIASTGGPLGAGDYVFA